MDIDRLKRKAQELYGRQHLRDRCSIYVEAKDSAADLKALRHEDGKHSGTWITVPIFIPDDEE